MLNKTLKVAAGFCLMATTAFAQMPQLTELPVQKIAPAKLSLEQMKGNFEAVKMQRPAMRMNKVNLSDRVMKPMTGIIPGVKQVMTRAGAFGAYYEVPAGIYNIKSGFEYMEGFSTFGIPSICNSLNSLISCCLNSSNFSAPPRYLYCFQ